MITDTMLITCRVKLVDELLRMLSELEVSMSEG